MNITINEAGVIHLKDCLSILHKGYAKIDSIGINGWLSKAEDNYRSGKGAEVEIKAHASTTGKSEVIKFCSDFFAVG